MRKKVAVNPEVKRKQVSDLAEKMIDAAMLQVTNLFEKELQRTLDDWGKRYPRHSFKAFQSHGMLSVYIYPMIGKHPINNWDYIPVHMRKGAVATLCDEIEALIDWHCALEWKMATFESEKPFVSKKP